MTTRQVLSIAIDTLKSRRKKTPNAEVEFPTELGTQKISIDVAIAQIENLYHWCYDPFDLNSLENLYHWCYDPFDLNSLEKVCHCRNCEFYKKFHKKNAPKRVFKMLCSLDRTEKPENWYCPKGKERSSKDGSAKE